MGEELGVCLMRFGGALVRWSMIAFVVNGISDRIAASRFHLMDCGRLNWR